LTFNTSFKLRRAKQFNLLPQAQLAIRKNNLLFTLRQANGQKTPSLKKPEFSGHINKLFLS
jgi:hypothetical protein